MSRSATRGVTGGLGRDGRTSPGQCRDARPLLAAQTPGRDALGSTVRAMRAEWRTSRKGRPRGRAGETQRDGRDSTGGRRPADASGCAAASRAARWPGHENREAAARVGRAAPAWPRGLRGTMRMTAGARRRQERYADAGQPFHKRRDGERRGCLVRGEHRVGAARVAVRLPRERPT